MTSLRARLESYSSSSPPHEALGSLLQSGAKTFWCIKREGKVDDDDDCAKFHSFDSTGSGQSHDSH